MLCSKNRGCLILFLLFFLHNGNSAKAADNPEKNVKIEHLPRITLPVSYEIELVPHIVEGNFTFDGQSKINVIVLQDTPKLILHSKNLTIDEHFTSLVDTNGVTRKAKKHSHVDTANFLVIEFNELITVGNYTLNLKYAGQMKDGIYNSSYVDEIGEKKWFVASSFFLAKARTVFPCWDEFDIESTFNLSIKHYPNVTAVSNMPVRTETPQRDGKILTNFHTTPRMPVDRLRFVVSDFDCIRSAKRRLSFCSRKEFVPYLKYPLDVTERAIGLLEKYLGSKYNSPKLDQFVIPRKKPSCGGPLPWESIKYEECDFNKTNMLMAMQEGAVTVVQQVARDWIASLVNLESMNSTWITEGLSNYLGFYIVDEMFPHWRQMDVFVIKHIQASGFFWDSWSSFKPLEWFPDDPNDVPDKYSHQFFIRGGNLFYMMSNILTETTLKQGIRKFLKQSENRPVTTDDFWNSLQSAFDENNQALRGSLSIKHIMKSWVEQVGYPLVSVNRDYSTGNVIITQEGFMKNYTANRYWIPINFASKSNPNFDHTTPTHWLKPEDESLLIEGIRKDDWIVVNIQSSGYYCVNYDETNWERIADYLNTDDYKKIHVRNRAEFIEDLFALSRTQRRNHTTFLDVARYLAREDDYLPWYPTIRQLDWLREMISGWELDELISKYFLGLIDHIARTIDFDDSDKYNGVAEYQSITGTYINRTEISLPKGKHAKKSYKRETFFTRRYGNSLKYTACGLGHPLCTQVSQEEQVQAFYNHLRNLEIPSSPRISDGKRCYELPARTEDELLQTLSNASDTTYVRYLVCSPDKNALRDFLKKALTGESNLSADQFIFALRYFVLLSKNTADNNVDYFIDNFNAIYKYIEKALDSEKAKTKMTGVIYMSTQMVYTSEQMQKLSDLIAKESNRIYTTRLQGSIDREKKRIEWREKNAPQIGQWFREHSIDNVTAA